MMKLLYLYATLLILQLFIRLWTRLLDNYTHCLQHLGQFSTTLNNHWTKPGQLIDRNSTFVKFPLLLTQRVIKGLSKSPALTPCLNLLSLQCWQKCFCWRNNNTAWVLRNITLRAKTLLDCKIFARAFTRSSQGQYISWSIVHRFVDYTMDNIVS